MPGVFISYRRDDCPGHAGRLFDRLRHTFGTDSVFIDVAGIEAGVDFVEVLERAVGSCDVLLAVIGREWVTSTDKRGRRRLHEPRDFIRLEITTALERNVRVIPILVEDAPMPSADALPDDLVPLTRRQAIELRDTRWDADVDDLIVQLSKLLRVARVTRAREAHLDQSNAPRVPSVDTFIQPSELRHRQTVAAPRPRRSPSVAWSMAALVLVVCGLLAAGLVAPAVLLNILGIQPSIARDRPTPAHISSPRRFVPDVVGQTVADAQRAIAAAGLSEEAVTVVARDAAPGTVVHQEPAGGTPVPDGPGVDPRVRLGVAGLVPVAPSQGRGERGSMRVPDVVGQNLERGSDALRKAGLAVGSATSKTARGTAAFAILSQTPAGGSVVGAGTRVDLVYAKPMRLLPDVEGNALEDAIAALEASGFVPQPRARGTNDAPSRKVLAQTPVGGTEVEPGAAVELVYAVPAKITVPTVVGLDVQAAQRTLRAAGLVVGSRTETDADAPPNQVVRQDPSPGSEVEKNTPVALFYAPRRSPEGEATR